MKVFQVTNRATHSRAVIIAANEQKACELRPDGAIWSSTERAFIVYDRASQTFKRAPELPTWPVEPTLVRAQALSSYVTREFEVEHVVAFEQTLTPRQRGEGPDDWWSDEDDA